MESFRILAVISILTALCLVIFLPGLSNRFIMDDEAYLSRNPLVLGGLSSDGIRRSLTSFHGRNWSPLTLLSHMLDVSFFGLDPRGHHLVNLLWHAANAVILFLLLRGYTSSLWKSAFVSALFAVHPLHVESVAWAAERKDVLSTFFWFSAMLAYLGWVRKPCRHRYALVALLYAAALMAKPMPVTFPFLLLLLDWWPLGRLRGPLPSKSWSIVLLEKLPLLALSAALVLVTYLAQMPSMGSIPLLDRLLHAARSYVSYLWKTVWPVDLALYYPYPIMPTPLWETAAAMAVLVLVTALAIMARRGCPAFGAGWLWYLVSLVPVIGLVQVGDQAMADRYTYVPLVGIFILAAWCIDALTAGWRSRAAWMTSVAFFMVALLATLATAQVRRWKDPITAFSHALRVTKDNYIIHNNLGLALKELGRNQEAKAHFLRAISLNKNLASAHDNLGLILLEEWKIQEAKEQFIVAWRLQKGNTIALRNLGTALGMEGRMDEARALFREADRIDQMR